MITLAQLFAQSSVQTPWYLGTKYPVLKNDTTLSEIPESTLVRREVYDSYINAPLKTVLNFKSIIVKSDSERIKIETEVDGDFVFEKIVFEKNKTFSDYSQGSWIIKRSKKDGSFVQVKIFLRSDPKTCIRIYPFKDRSKIDLIVYGAVLVKEALLPLPFINTSLPSKDQIGQINPTILTSSLKEIQDLTKETVPWKLFEFDTDLYANTRKFVQSLRSSLNLLEYDSDAALDADLINKKIENLSELTQTNGKIKVNCSGFVKWLIDGVLLNLGGSATSIKDLKLRYVAERGSSFTEPYESVLDPFFGLDWTRNLSLKYHEFLYPSRKFNISDFDLRDSYFSLLSGMQDVLNTKLYFYDYPDYVQNQGFRVDGLKAILYVLALKEPGNFYLGSFNKIESLKTKAVPEGALFRRHYHVAAFFPYFTQTGEFEVAVFESAAETSLDKILEEKSREFVQLVRIPLEAGFTPIK